MNLELLPKNIQSYLKDACVDLGIEIGDLGFWDVSDYGIFVMMTESFYKTLNYRKADPSEFHMRLTSGNFEPSQTYPDSRTYMSVLVEHFQRHSLSPTILDIGGYIGRFSLESALMLRDRNIDLPKIICFEPGLSRNVIRANFSMNGVEDFIQLRLEAASDENATAEYNYTSDGLISGRICDFPSAEAHRSVKTARLDSILMEIGCNQGIIVKIDTEGHEPSVMAGLGTAVNEIPSAYIVEFWPATLKQTVNGVGYADYIEEHFVVFDLKSSLYPRFYTPVPDIREFARNFKMEEGNVDLLFLNRLIPDVEELVRKLKGL